MYIYYLRERLAHICTDPDTSTQLETSCTQEPYVPASDRVIWAGPLTGISGWPSARLQYYHYQGIGDASLAPSDQQLANETIMWHFFHHVEVTKTPLQDADRDVSLAVRWENLLAGIQRLRDIRQSVELKTLIRLGIPTQHKEAVWNM